jgi:hypothetical protein
MRSINIMSQLSPLEATSLDISRITVSKPKDVSKDGMTFGKRIYLQYNDPVQGIMPLIIKTPKMNFKFGLSAWDSDNNQKKYVLNSYFKDWNTSVESVNKKFYDFYCALEKKISELIAENSESWMNVKKAYTLDLVQQMELLYPIVKRSHNKESGEEYPPCLKFNFPRYPNKSNGKYEFNTEVFLNKGKKITIDPEAPSSTITPNSEGYTVVFCSLFVSKATKKVSMTMNANMIKVYPNPKQVITYPFNDSEEDESDTEEVPEKPVETKTHVKAEESEPDSSDSESELSESEPDSEESETETEPEPTPVVQKKRAAKKVKLPTV